MYFETNNIKSFYRQLYYYKFKTHRHSNARGQYTHANFQRNQYASMMKLKRNIEQSDKDLEADALRLEHKTLKRKYEECLRAVNDLREHNSELIKRNKETAAEEMDFRYNLSQRIRMGLLVFVIQSKYYSRECDSKIKRLADKQQYIKPPLTDDDVENIITSKRLPEVLRAHTHNLLANPLYSSIYFAKILKVVLRYINNKFFNMPFDLFYRSVVLYVLGKEDPVGLIQHFRFGVIKELKEAVDGYYDVTIGSLTSHFVTGIFQEYYRAQPCEFLVSDGRPIDEHTDESYSMRSLKDQLLLNQLDMISLFSADLDAF